MSFKMIANLTKLARFSYLSKSSFTVSKQPAYFYMIRNFSSSPEIAIYEEIKKLPQNPDVLLIDVREPEELEETGKIPTSINIPLGQVKEKLSSDFSQEEFKKIFGRDKPNADSAIIFMCKIGGRSGKALEVAKQLGYKNGRNYLGSWEEWKVKEGLPK